MKKIIQLFAAVCFTLWFSSAFATQATTPTSFLYVIHADHGKLQPSPAHEYVLQLTPMHQQVIYFSDRPHRSTGAITIKNFLALWSTAAGSNSFSLDNPNAAIAALGTDGKQYHQDLVILGCPSYNAHTNELTFTIKALGPHTSLTPFIANELTVFIDQFSPENFSPGWS